MKKLLLLLIGPLIAGCFIHLNIKVNLFPDGRVARETDYATDTKSELEDVYLLPANGSWHCDTTEKGAVWHYTVEENFPDYKKIVSAYVRKGKRPGDISSSRPHIRISRYFFFTDYEYREEFFDAADTTKAKAVFKKLCDIYTESLGRRMKQDAFSAEEVTKAKGWLGVWWNGFYQLLVTGKGMGGFEDKDLAQGLAAALYDTSRLTAGEKIRLGNRLEKLLKMVDEDISRQVDTQSVALDAEDIFGVYGIVPTSDYTFEVEIILPGSVIRTNGARVASNPRLETSARLASSDRFASNARLASSVRLVSSRVRWQFQNRDFFAQGYRLYAKTRVINFLNCALVGVVIIAGVAAVFFFGRRRKI